MATAALKQRPAPALRHRPAPAPPGGAGANSVAIEFRDDLLFGERIHLLQENDRSARVLPLLPFGLKFVADFAGTDQDSFRFSDSRIGDDVQEILMREILDRGTRVRVA